MPPRKAARRGDARIHAAQVLTNAAHAVLLDAVNAETGARGYAATGDPAFLAPYQLTLNRIGADLRSLQAAAATVSAANYLQAIDTSTARAELGRAPSAQPWRRCCGRSG